VQDPSIVKRPRNIGLISSDSHNDVATAYAAAIASPDKCFTTKTQRFLGEEFGWVNPEAVVTEPISPINNDPNLMVVGTRAWLYSEFKCVHLSSGRTPGMWLRRGSADSNDAVVREYCLCAEGVIFHSPDVDEQFSSRSVRHTNLLSQ
jgi:hypothetical protein